jgi:hypothetical protein
MLGLAASSAELGEAVDAEIDRGIRAEACHLQGYKGWARLHLSQEARAKKIVRLP